jgi:integrase
VVEVVRKAFNLAIRWGWRSDNPASGVHRNREDKRTRYLSAAEIVRLSAALLAHPERSSAGAIKLLLLTGARRTEVLAARWDMFDLDRGVWVKPSAHTKQRKEHRVPLSEPARQLMLEIRARTPGSYVFPGRKDGPLTDVKRTWAAVCKAAGIQDCRLHDLRHTYASILASDGSSLLTIGGLLGHSQPQTTARYAHLLDTSLRAATERVGAFVDRDSHETFQPARKGNQQG